MNIIYEDDSIIVVFKKAGQLTQSGKNFDVDLTSQVLSYRKKKGEEVYAALINRLDRPVSGLVLFAKTRKAAAELSKELQKGGFNKQYYAIVCGKLPDKKGHLVDYLKKDEKNNISFVVDKGEPGAKPAELEYEVVKELESTEGSVFTVVKIHLITGRHHQIRVQFALRSLPLLGDGKYGRETGSIEGLRLARQEIALCAASLEAAGQQFTVVPQWGIDLE